MNRVGRMAILIGVVNCGFAQAENEPALDPKPKWPDRAEETGLWDRVLKGATAREAVSPDGELRAVWRQSHPNVYGHNFGKVAIYDRLGRVVARGLFGEHGGRLVANAKWTPDSPFCVFTTSSAGGHSPWHYDPYIFCIAERRFFSLEDATDDFEGVIDWRFSFPSFHVVRFITRQGSVRIDLRKLRFPDAAWKRGGDLRN